jgi:single-stranded-DNA-specific exonuclease
MGKYLWIKSDFPPGKISEIMAEISCSKAIAVYLAARKIWKKDEIEKYFNPSLSMLDDPFSLPGVEKASERIWKAIRNKERILIFGDYDTDGVTASVLLYGVLQAHGASVSCFLPHRFDDGYGMTAESLDKALSLSLCSLIITVDCGISAFDAISSASAKGIDVIISDHHEPGTVLPDAYAVINPKIHPEYSHLQILAGVGVAFKLAHGFIKFGRGKSFCADEYDLREDFDLLALGTVADMVPLIGENRIMVRKGLKILSEQLRPGIRALCEFADIGGDVKSSDITFSLSPRVNAAGRLENAKLAFDLLVDKNYDSALKCAEAINVLNLSRQKTEENIFNQALKEIDNQNLAECRTITVYGENWHLGVIGIVASRMAKEFCRPTVVFSIQGETAFGSARSVGKVNILEMLSENSVLFHRYGGHMMAAGISMSANKLCEFRKSFEDSAAKRLNNAVGSPEFEFDGEIFLGDLLHDGFFESLHLIEPFGYGNANPVYRINRLRVEKLMPAARIHSRGTLIDERGENISFIAFNFDNDSFRNIRLMDVIATPQMNKFRSENSPQLQIHDFKTSGHN